MPEWRPTHVFRTKTALYAEFTPLHPRCPGAQRGRGPFRAVRKRTSGGAKCDTVALARPAFCSRGVLPRPMVDLLYADSGRTAIPARRINVQSLPRAGAVTGAPRAGNRLSGAALLLAVPCQLHYYNYPTVNYVYTTPSVVESPSYNSSPTIVTEPPAPARAVTNTATMIVRVPADPDVWFNGEPTSMKGEVREFTSPPLTPGSDYRYDIRARWTDAGGAADQTRTVVVRANGRTEVDFTRPEPVAPPTPPSSGGGRRAVSPGLRLGFLL
jgi:uncharacterized protein (TIGR03000 family)